MIELKDQNGTIHQFVFDALGRQTEDKVTEPGTDVDGGVRCIGRSYEVRGLIEKITSYNHPTARADINVVNQVEFAYNHAGLPVAEYQEHGTVVSISTSPKVKYFYDETVDGSDELTKGLRLKQIVYPDGRKLRYEYANGADDALGRVSYLADDSFGSVGTKLAEYTRLGLGQAVRVDYHKAGASDPILRYNLAHGDNEAYDGLDAFGRVKDLRWTSYDGNTDHVHIKHGHDEASNRLYREDVKAGAADLDELYTYDELNRLTLMQRGNVNTTAKTISPVNFAQQWCLDETGNWSGFDEGDDTANWDLEQARGHNRANEITDVDETNGPSWTTPVHDKAGNMTTIPQPAAPTEGFDLTYDAWNRLVQVDSDCATVAEYEYDGLGRRTVKQTYPTVECSSSSSSSSSGTTETRHFYYSVGWQVLEERVDSTDSSSSSSSGDPGDAERQYVWGLRYIDDLILRDRDTTGSGGLDERLYAMQDASFNVVAIADTAGAVTERFIYDAYGKATGLADDFTEYSGTDYDWEYLYTGRRLDEETGLQYSRARYYHTTLGRFTQRDPIGYDARDMNLYRYVRNSPTNAVDPFGALEFKWERKPTVYTESATLTVTSVPGGIPWGPNPPGALAVAIPRVVGTVECKRCKWRAWLWEMKSISIVSYTEVYVHSLDWYKQRGIDYEWVLRAEGDHVADFTVWSHRGGFEAMGIAMALTKQKTTFKDKETCLTSVLSVLSATLQPSLREATRRTIRVHDVSGRHTWGGANRRD